MARKPRLHYPGAVYHVILRGNARQEIFFANQDRFRFYLLMQEGVERYGYRIHAFCLMANHVHLAIQVGDVPLWRIMQNLCFRYTRWVNRQQGRVGHLFQGRYKAVLVDADSYLLELTRYIHLNPLRAGLVKKLEKYPWSSHLAYLGDEKFPWLTTDWVLSQFSSRQSRARREYRKFVNDGKSLGHLREFHGGSKGEGRVLGDEPFIDRVLRRGKSRIECPATIEQIIKRVCDHYGLEGGELSAAGKSRVASGVRGMVAWLVLESGRLTLTELSKLVRRDISTLSSAARHLLIRSKKDVELARRMAKLRRETCEIQISQA